MSKPIFALARETTYLSALQAIRERTDDAEILRIISKAISVGDELLCAEFPELTKEQA